MNKTLIPNSLGYEVLTPEGWQSFAGVATMGENKIYKVLFEDGTKVECSPKHRFFVNTEETVRADALLVGQIVVSETGKVKVISCVETDRTELTYSLIEVDGGHKYYTNGILSANCEFITDDEVLINPLTLNRLKAKDPEFYIGTSRWYQEPAPNRAYLVALDPALGTNNDYSAIQVFQMPEMIQIAEWKANNLSSRLQVKVLMDILYALDGILRENPEQTSEPEIFWTFENNTIGEGVLTIIEDTHEDRFPGQLVTERRRKGLNQKRVRRGLNTTNRNKLSACARLKSLIESDRMTLYSANLLRELKNFVGTGMTFKAKPGEHDDMVMSTLLIVRMLDIVLSWGTDAGDLREYITDDELFLENEPMPVVI